MATRVMDRERAWDWLRVGAWSGSFATHVGIILLVALPVAAPLTRRVPVAEAIIARSIESEPPPAVPEPPPPTVPRHARQTPARIVSAPVDTPPIASEAAVPTPVAPDTTNTTETIESSAAATASSDIGSGGATQVLAYADPLQPRYPPASVRAHEQGMVLLRVLVDAVGVPQRVEIARSSGHSRLDAAARDTVMRARFRPVMRNGEAASAWGLVPIEFRLDRG